MSDYARLADVAKQKGTVDKSVIEQHKELRADPCSFFNSVKASLLEEMNKANVELRKKKAPIFDQLHLPNFDEEFILTFGTDSICRVGRGIMRGGCRITAVLSGPPNGYEISRREYLCKKEAACREVITIEEPRSKPISFAPAEVAEDIISGVLFGRFY